MSDHTSRRRCPDPWTTGALHNLARALAFAAFALLAIAVTGNAQDDGQIHAGGCGRHQVTNPDGTCGVAPTPACDLNALAAARAEAQRLKEALDGMYKNDSANLDRLWEVYQSSMDVTDEAFKEELWKHLPAPWRVPFFVRSPDVNGYEELARTTHDIAEHVSESGRVAGTIASDFPFLEEMVDWGVAIKKQLVKLEELGTVGNGMQKDQDVTIETIKRYVDAKKRVEELAAACKQAGSSTGTPASSPSPDQTKAEALRNGAGQVTDLSHSASSDLEQARELSQRAAAVLRQRHSSSTAPVPEGVEYADRAIARFVADDQAPRVASGLLRYVADQTHDIGRAVSPPADTLSGETLVRFTEAFTQGLNSYESAMRRLAEVGNVIGGMRRK